MNSICQGSVFVLSAISTGKGSHGLGGWCTSEMAAAPDGVSSRGTSSRDSAAILY